jgi:oligo-1,6-glucosidase
VWHYYRTLIDLRREYPALVYGDYQAALEEDDQVHAYLRCLGEDVFLVVLNFTRGPVAPQWPNHLFDRTARLLVCNYPVSATATVTDPLRPFEARLYRVE